MDVFDQWEGDRQQPRGGGGGLGPNPFTPDNSPPRAQAAARRGGGGGGGVDALRGTEPQHAADVFSLRRIDLPATVLGGPGAAPTPRTSARAAALAAAQATPARTILQAAVQSHVLVLAMSDGCVVRWALDGSREPETVPILPSAAAASAPTPRGSSSAGVAPHEEIRRLFLDPTGTHLVVASTAAEYYYLHARAARPRRLAKWQGLVVESIAFDRAYGGEGSTKAILLGTDQGQIYETALEYSGSSSSSSSGGGSGSLGGSGGGSSLASAASASSASAAAAALMGGVGGGASGAGKEHPVVKVHELEQPLPIRALEFELLRDGPLLVPAAPDAPSDPTAASTTGRLLLVLAATSNPVRLYKFLGGPTFDALFARYRDGVGSLTFQDFGGSPGFTAAELHLYRSSPNGKAESLALMTEAGIFHGKLVLSPPPASTDSIITEASLTEYLGSDGRSLLSQRGGSGGGGVASPPRQRRGGEEGGGASWPLSLALSEFQFLLLYPRRLQVVSRLSGRQVQHNPLPLDEGAMGPGRIGHLLFDTAQGTYWLYAEKALFQVTLAREEEGRFVWRLYLDKALQGDTRKFDLAYKHARDARARATVDGAQAAYYFKRGQYELAARFYARLVHPGSANANSFEEVALRFVEAGPEGGEAGLRVFLLERLALLGGGGGGGGEEGGSSAISNNSSSGDSWARFKTQRVMLCTWLLELYLKRLAALAPSDVEGEDGKQEQQEEEYDATVEEVRAFLQTHIEDLRLHPPTTYELLASHGRKQEMLLYATLIEDVERVVALYLQDHDTHRALAVLESAPLERVEPLFYRHAHTLLTHAPLPTLSCWLRKRPGLDPAKLLPAIVHLIAACDAAAASPSATAEAKAAAKEARAAAVRYLERCVEEGEGYHGHGEEGGVHGGRGAVGALPSGSSGGGVGPAPAILYNYLLRLYAQGGEGEEENGGGEERLLAFLQAHAGAGGLLDLAYALRVCARHGRTRACVHLYSCMGMYEEAVALALRSGDVALAKEHADMPPLHASGAGGGGVTSPAHLHPHDDGAGLEGEGDGGLSGGEALRKRLWLMVARHLIEVRKIRVKEALALLEECPLLHIEDLLPHLPDLAAIDDVRDRVCHALVRYSDTIKGLKADMAETAQSAAEVERALQQLQHRHLPFPASQGCALCAAPAMASQFYLFPCRHAFHADCLAGHVLPHLSPIQRRAVHDLREQLSAELTALGLASVPPPPLPPSSSAGADAAGGAAKVSKRKAAQLEALQAEIDGYLAAECPLCGDLIIRTVGAPLLSEEEEARGDARAWALD